MPAHSAKSFLLRAALAWVALAFAGQVGAATITGRVFEDANGVFTYTYTGTTERCIRVVNGTVRSERTGGTTCTTCVPVQTYRVEAPAGSLVTVTNEVGGRGPALVDAAQTTGTMPGTTATTTTQSWSAVDPNNSGDTVSGIDFGFNFDTVVSTRDA